MLETTGRQKAVTLILAQVIFLVASHADVLRLVTRSSPRTSAQQTGHFCSLAVLKELIRCYVMLTILSFAMYLCIV